MTDQTAMNGKSLSDRLSEIDKKYEDVRDCPFDEREPPTTCDFAGGCGAVPIYGLSKCFDHITKPELLNAYLISTEDLRLERENVADMAGIIDNIQENLETWQAGCEARNRKIVRLESGKQWETLFTVLMAFGALSFFAMLLAGIVR